MPSLTIVMLIAFLTACVVSDLRTRRIPNLLSGATMLAGVALNTAYFGTSGLAGSLAGLVMAVILLLFPFALGGIGGGDVKMMGAVGTLLGPRITLAGLCFGLILGGATIAIHLSQKGRLREKLAAVGTMVTAAALTRSFLPLKVSASDQDAVSLPYSLPLALGVIAALGITGA